MGRTNIELDDALVTRAMSLYGVRTKREAVHLALERLVGRGERQKMLDLRGSGWEGNLSEMRAGRVE